MILEGGGVEFKKVIREDLNIATKFSALVWSQFLLLCS